MKIDSKSFIPVEIVFHPNWWFKNYNISFKHDYFYNPKIRVEVEQRMQRAMYERFGQFGYGEANPSREPIIGPVHLATGYLVSAVWGCKVEYYDDASPQPLCRRLSIQELDSMPEPDINCCTDFVALLKLIEALKGEFGYVMGDIAWGSMQNLALDLLGENLFLAYHDDPAAVHRVYTKLNKITIEIVNHIRYLTGTSSISINRSILNVDPSINLNGNCSVQMISNEQYETFILPHELELAKKLQPYGIHHCGNNMHTVVEGYSKVPDCYFFDVGWGSDIEQCRKMLPDAFFNIRLSPVKIKDCTPGEVRDDIEKLFAQIEDLTKIGLCCINMDYGTPDENVAMIFETAQKFRKFGG